MITYPSLTECLRGTSVPVGISEVDSLCQAVAKHMYMYIKDYLSFNNDSEIEISPDNTEKNNPAVAGQSSPRA
jgi:hypothetical protein